MANLETPSIELTAPFANNGDRNELKEFEKDADIGRANLETGFPRLSGTPLDEGGIPPAREDFNAILHILSEYAIKNAKNIFEINEELANSKIDESQVNEIIDNFINTNNIKMDQKDIFKEIDNYLEEPDNYSNLDDAIDDFLGRNPVKPTPNDIIKIIVDALNQDQDTQDAVTDLIEDAILNDQQTIDEINDLIDAAIKKIGVGITGIEVVQHINDALTKYDSEMQPEMQNKITRHINDALLKYDSELMIDLNKIIKDAFIKHINAIDFVADQKLTKPIYNDFRNQIINQIKEQISLAQAKLPKNDRFDDTGTNNIPNIDDSTSVTSPKYVYLLFKWMTNKPAAWNPSMGALLNEFGEQIIGVVDTGERTVDGAVLEYIDKDFNIIQNLQPNYFDNHASYKFTETMIGNDVFIKIPIAYWRRGLVPSGYDLSGKWYMMIAPAPFTDFLPNQQAFNYNSFRKDAFYFAKYRAGWDAANNKITSQPDTRFYGNMTFNNFKAQAQTSGDGYMMQSIFHFHEIMARMVIEKKTFNISPSENSINENLCQYRGIEHLFFSGFHPVVGGAQISSEWIDGIRFDSNYYIEHFAVNNDGSFVKTKKTNTRGGYSSSQIANNKIYKLLTDDVATAPTQVGLDQIFLSDTSYSYSQANSDPDGEKTMIPYQQYWGNSSANIATLTWIDGPGFGAFGFLFNKTPNEAGATIGSRLVKM